MLLTNGPQWSVTHKWNAVECGWLFVVLPLHVDLSRVAAFMAFVCHCCYLPFCLMFTKESFSTRPYIQNIWCLLPKTPGNKLSAELKTKRIHVFLIWDYPENTIRGWRWFDVACQYVWCDGGATVKRKQEREIRTTLGPKGGREKGEDFWNLQWRKILRRSRSQHT